MWLSGTPTDSPHRGIPENRGVRGGTLMDRTTQRFASEAQDWKIIYEVAERYVYK